MGTSIVVVFDYCIVELGESHGPVNMT